MHKSTALFLRFLLVLPPYIFSYSAQGSIKNNLDTCSIVEKADILAPATLQNHTVYLSCHLSLSATDILTKKIIIQGEAASGVQLNCNHGLIDMNSGIAAGIFAHSDNTITIQSVKLSDSTWSAPENITVENCHIKGNIRIIGMGKNGEAQNVNASSQTLGHTQRANDAAPHHIMLNNLTIESIVRTPLYIAPGVHHVTFQHSNIQGSSSSVALYLDAESNYNHILNNQFHASGPREVMALDGSAFNTVSGNLFSAINHGGIYLYRNCGQGGTVRHQTPSHNIIEHNYFYYDQYTGNNPAIYISARNGNKNYCEDDSDANLPGTSSTDNNDNAQNNLVRYNQFLNRDPTAYLRFGLRLEDAYLNVPSTYGNKRVSQFHFGATLTPSMLSPSNMTYDSSCQRYVY
ncbi:hypothetical protein [uncultured Shewanella sp.]|uniref:hypothetical protein n=1 Tax=uncultured Shewanella sp. TaxID=173975 RepID=UPI002620ECE0|nr:hypothetical protein [uncultured Shewanella sp.]